MITPRSRVLVAAAIVAATAPTSTLVVDLLRAVTAPGDYADRRAVVAFKGLDVDAVRARLDASLPRETPVMIAPRVAGEIDLATERLGSTFWFPRLTEALYPRPVVVSAPHVLELLPDRLVVGPDVAPRDPPPPLEDLGLHPFALLGGVLSLLGYGLALRRFVAPDDLASTSAILCAAFVRGALVIGVVAMAATWSQVPVPPAPVAALGAALAVVAVVRARRRGALVLRRPTPLQWAAGGAVGAVLAAAAAFPYALWDGRSIWLFHAKQLRLFGHVPAPDFARAELAFTHLEYPLLFPAVVAHGSALAAVYAERAAAVVAPLFAAVCAALLYVVARARASSAGAAAVVGVVVLAGAHVALGVYADVVVALLVAATAAALLRPETANVGWLCFACAACSKQEGLLFGAIVVVACVAARRARITRHALLVLPAVVHVVWARAVALPSDFAGTDVAASLADLPARLVEIAVNVGVLVTTGGYHHAEGAMIVGALVLPATCAVLVAKRRLRSDAGLVAATSVVVGAVVVGIFVVSPRLLDWHVQTAADRLLLTPSGLAVLALFLALADDGMG